jgi:molybdopterin-dependent oxidoreductase alpha subunit
MTNESYYVAQKAVRALGSPNVDNAARICHSPSTYGLRDTLGVAATTCSYTDLIAADLVVFVGANPANNQPVTMKYLLQARRSGTRVVCVNPHREPGMERYWIPSDPESALFGTRMTDRWFQVHTGGDLAFLTGALKHLVERGWVDREFVDSHTRGYAELETLVRGQQWEQLERGAGVAREEMLAFAQEVHAAGRAVFVWSMGATQHARGEDIVRAIVNVALSGGFVGREGCGLMPIRGHSGVQGGAEMGCYATALPGNVPVTQEAVAALSETWGFDVPARRGLTAPEMIDAAHERRLDVLLSAGGNFLEVLPDPGWVREALARVPLRVHMDVVLTPQMLLDPAEAVVLLPMATRYEVAGGVTQTSTERRVILSPAIPGGPGRIPQARAEWEVFGELAARARPQLAGAVRFAGTREIRSEIARVVPGYEQIAELGEGGDSFQVGGERLCEGRRFPTPDGRASFAMVLPPAPAPRDGLLRLSTRRGKQFNSMVQASRDGLTGAAREDVLMSADDAARLGFADGDPVLVRSEHGELRGRARVSAVRPGDVQVHWPEGNTLLDRRARSPQAGVPDYNARVEIMRA